ncbi:MAG TPA: histidine kinase dimerization/phospho-acceptor domain-containing protein, partial [Flavilitoribacter sp.]|nr:histidine kinase dimerization/phospho-acceptor domain-containing protein [Flavilitoribacter sp.]
MDPLPFIKNKGKKTSVQIILSFLLTTGCIGFLNAQNKDSVDLSSDLWPAIEARFDQQPADTAFHFILELIREHCLDDDNCRFHTGKSIMFQLERRFNLMCAVYIAKDVLNITKEQGDFERQGGMYLNLSRYHRELGIHQRAAEYLDLALEAFQKEGSYMAIVETKMTKLEQSALFRKPEEYLPEMDALLAEAVKMKDSRAICFLHARILGFKTRTGRLDEALAHISAIETMTSPFSSRLNSRAMYITAVRARGIIAMMKNDRTEAEKHFLKALQLCEKTPNTWMEINLLDKLTEIAWDRGDADQAKAYLDRAHEKAMEQQVDNLLEITYEWKAYIAEKEGRFADALEYTREMHKHRDNYSARSAGFNLENYYLQQEKETLAVEKENRDPELQLRKRQLRSSFIIIGLALFLALTLAFAFNNQWKRKRELATQNALIKQQAGQLKELDTAKTRFFANVSHELRTPLTLIRGPIGSLLDGNGLTEKQTHLLQLADKSGKQLQQLVTEILDLGKLDLGKLRPDPMPTELSTFFGSYFAQFESLAER